MVEKVGGGKRQRQRQRQSGHRKKSLNVREVFIKDLKPQIICGLELKNGTEETKGRVLQSIMRH